MTATLAIRFLLAVATVLVACAVGVVALAIFDCGDESELWKDDNEEGTR